MATSTRDKLVKSTAFKVIIWVTILSMAGIFSLSEVVSYLFSRPAWVVAVNGQKMSLNDLARKVTYQEQLIQSIRQQYGNYADMFIQMMGLTGNPEDRALDQLIGETLLDQAADTLSLAISPEHINEKLLEPSFVYQHADVIPPYLIDATGAINMRNLNAYLQRMNLSLADVQHALGKSIKRDFLVNTNPEVSSLVELSVYTPTFAIKDQYLQDNSAKKFSVLTFDFDTFLKKAKSDPITESELQLFFDERVAQKKYLVPEKRSGIMWRFEPRNYGISVSSNEIESYYDTHRTKEFIEKPAQLEIRKIVIAETKEQMEHAAQQADRIHEQLMKDPSQFAAVAQEMSQDKETAAHGGLMAPFARGTHEREFEKAAFALTEDGAISPVIKSDDAFIIVQRVAKHPAIFKPLPSVEQNIRDTLIQKKFNQEFMADMKGNAELFGRTNDQASAFFKDKKAQEEKINKKTKDSSRAAQALFASKKGSYHFYLDGDIGVVVLLQDIAKQHQPSLEAIHATVEEDFYTQRALNMLEEAVAQARTDAQTKSFKEVGDLYGASLEVIDFISAKDDQRMKDIAQKGVPIKEMMHIEKPHLFIAKVSGRNGYLARLDEIKPLDEQEFIAQYEATAQKAKQAITQQVIAGFVASLYRNATIKTNESVINA